MVLRKLDDINKLFSNSKVNTKFKHVYPIAT